MNNEKKKEATKNFMEVVRSNGFTIATFGDTYFTAENNDNLFFYVQFNDWNISCTIYKKINCYLRQQCEYPMSFSAEEQVLCYMLYPTTNSRVLSGTYEQRLYLTELYGISNGNTSLYKLKNELAKDKEKKVLSHLKRIEMLQKDNECIILKFSSENDFFNYECKNKIIL